jgi:hypothetical protein
MKRRRKLQKPIAVRLDDEALAAVNSWRKTHDDPPTKSEALRLLVEAQLSTLGLWTPEAEDEAQTEGSGGRLKKQAGKKK